MESFAGPIGPEEFIATAETAACSTTWAGG